MGSSNSTKADWAALRALTGGEWRTLLAAAALLPLCRAGLRLFGYRRVERVTRRAFTLGPPRADEADLAFRTARMVSVAARRGAVAANCLPRSLVLWALLRRQGVDAVLRFGFRKGQGEFGAHAWVEHLGAPLNDADDVAEVFEVVDMPPS